MRRSLSAIIVLAACCNIVTPALAQSSVDPPLVEFAFSPGGTIVFTQKHAEPQFGDYGLGGAITVNLTRFVSVESQIGGSFGASQELNFGVASDVERKTPGLIDYSGDLVVSVRTGSSIVPFIAGGVGALTLFRREQLGIDATETYFTGNFGGGVKWLPRRHRWGLRGDYRFLAAQSKDDAPSFFGRNTRYGHRVYGSILVDLTP